MIYNVYTVYDSVTQEAGPPFTAVNDGIARRMFKNMNIPESFKSDYKLARIGFYDSKDVQLAIDEPYEVTDKAMSDEKFKDDEVKNE